jgi:hypothetical protein
MDTVLSVEPSSTMINSRFFHVWLKILQTASSAVDSALYVGITTLTRAVFIVDDFPQAIGQ